MKNKFKAFKKLLTSNNTEFICEAHNGISAKIVEEAGFKAIWGSGLTISAQSGVRDNNELSWTQVMDNLEFMTDTTNVPILLDGDTGYGNFNNFQRLVKKLEQIEVAAVCIEDKLFPKTNSFISGEKQELADIEEFSGKISAGKDAQTNDDFSIIARVEAFIAGWGLDEALKRANAYYKAGADGILIHSALSRPDEIIAFKKEWGDKCPVIIVPTKYYSTPTEIFEKNNISVVIWANHILRSGIDAMQKTAKKIYLDKNLLDIEDNIATVSEIFRLQGAKELEDSESKYLPQTSNQTTAVILAASRGEELGDLTKEKPKSMIETSGRPILGRIIDAYNSSGIKSISVVTGYKSKKFNLPNVSYFENKKFKDTGEVYSLNQALQNIDKNQDIIISYGDVLFKKYISLMLLESKKDFTVISDTNWEENFHTERDSDFIACNLKHSRNSLGEEIELKEVNSKMKKNKINAEWMGLMKISKNKRKDLEKAVEDLLKRSNKKANIPDLMNGLIKKNLKINVIYTSGHWIDIDSLDDLIKASYF
tara:strand:- start:9099 stop:10712 length:1614 start_codon:yes stop_codon:yes gene_type:complete